MLQCFDRQKTAELGNCPIGDFIQYDAITNTTFTILNDYLDYCRVWKPCSCTPVVFRNNTDRTITTYFSGDIIYKAPPTPVAFNGQPPDGRSGPSAFTRYQCVPANGEVPQIVTSNITFLGPTFPNFGDPANTIAEALTNYNGTYHIFFRGEIAGNCSYPCPPPPPETLRDPDTVPCEWTVDQSNGTWCHEGTTQCCADYLLDACIYDVVYKANCSIRPDVFTPAVVNGSIVNVPGSQLLVGGPFYDCTYLSDCDYTPGVWNGTTQDPPSSITNCNSTYCNLKPCRLNNTILYGVNSTCYSDLNLGQNNTAFYYNVTILNATQIFGFVTVAGVPPAWLLFLASLSDGRTNMFIDTSQVTLYGSGTISCANLFSGPTCVTISFFQGLLYYPVYFQNSSYINGTLLSDTVFGGFFENFPMLAPYPSCQNLSIATNETLCTFVRNCANFYVGNYPAPGYSLFGQNTSGTVPLSAQCSVNVDTCAFPSPGNGHPMCDCTSTLFTGTVYLDEILEGLVEFVPLCTDCQNITVNCTDASTIILANCSYFGCTGSGCASSNCTFQTCGDVGCGAGNCTYEYCTYKHNINGSDPVPTYELTRILNLNTLNCSSHLFVPCQCPAFNDTILHCYNLTNCVDLTVAECQATPNCTVPTTYTVAGDQGNVTCQNGALVCDCNATLVLQTYPPANGSIGFHIANLPTTLSNVQIIDNSACYWNTAWELQQVDYEMVANFSIAEVDPYTEFGTMHTLTTQYNIGEGTEADFAENDRQTPYRRVCNNNGCPEKFICPLSARDFTCVIDAGADRNLPNYGVTIFSTWYELQVAIRDQGRCGNATRGRVIGIQYTRNFYNEPQSVQGPDSPPVDDSKLTLAFETVHSNTIYVSLDRAVVVGGNWWINSNVRNLTFCGIDFRYSGSTGNPLFYVNRIGSTQIDRLRFHNCRFDGAGARGAGIIDTNRLSRLEIRYSTITNWDSFAIRVLDCNNTIMEYNLLNRCVGRCIEFRYRAGVIMNHNTFVDCRGGDWRGVPIVNLRGTSFTSFFCDPTIDPNCIITFLLSGGTTFPACTGNNTCSVTQNVHLAEISAPDFDDTFFLFSGGAINGSMIKDNAVLKARYGLAFIYSDEVRPDNADQIMLSNPLVRPSKYRVLGRDVPPGTDIRIDGYKTVQIFGNLQIQIATSNFCNFPCSDAMKQAWRDKNFTCTANQNWTPETMPAYGDYVPRFGYWQYHNGSGATNYCEDFQTFPEDDLPLKYIYMNSANGSR